jgi:Ohr subfamily peroxiredoxin
MVLTFVTICFSACLICVADASGSTGKSRLFKRRCDGDNKVLYTTKVHTEGGRDGGSAKSADGSLDIEFALPGSKHIGVNPEQLLAAGWSACFLGALAIAAAKHNVTLPANRSVDAEIDLGNGEDGFLLAAHLSVSLPGIGREDGERLIEAAHQTCPYSRAVRGNIEVSVSLASDTTSGS